MKLCIDCKHCGYNNSSPTGGIYIRSIVPCVRIPLKVKINLVNGDKSEVCSFFCQEERYSSDPNACGESGKYWEPKDTVKSQ